MLDALLGFATFTVSAADAAEVMECCRVLGVSPRRQYRVAAALSFRVSLSEAKRLLLALDREGIAYTLNEKGGLPVLFFRLFHRPFLVTGLLLALALFLLSGSFLWEVRIEGLSGIPEAEIRESLALQGVSSGSFIPRVDTDAVALALREGDARIAHISLNRQGTVLSVLVREAESTPTPSPKSPANLVATKDGVVTLSLVFEGKPLVFEGDVVRAGDLLATGVLETDNNGTRLTRAAGSVMARTEETLTVDIPFSYSVSLPTGRVRHALYVNFFGRERKVFKNSGNLRGNCDIIEKIQIIRAWNGRELPFGWRLLTYHEMAECEQARTAREALLSAEAALSDMLAEASLNKTLLSRTVETVVSEEGVTLICTAVFEEDIARVAEFEIDG